MLDAFRLGGWGMFPTLAAGMLLLVTSLKFARRPDVRHMPVMLSLGVLTLAAGALGFVSGMIATTIHLGELREDAGIIALTGFGESLHNLALALFSVMLAAAIASWGTWKRSNLPPSTWNA